MLAPAQLLAHVWSAQIVTGIIAVVAVGAGTAVSLGWCFGKGGETTFGDAVLRNVIVAAPFILLPESVIGLVALGAGFMPLQRVLGMAAVSVQGGGMSLLTDLPGGVLVTTKFLPTVAWIGPVGALLLGAAIACGGTRWWRGRRSPAAAPLMVNAPDLYGAPPPRAAPGPYAYRV